MLSLNKQNALRERYRQQNPGWQPATEIFAGLVGSRLESDSQLLDLGCGRGGLIEQLNHPLSQVLALDPDLRSLQEHRLARSSPSLLRIAALSEVLPLADQSQDIVTASWLLEHLAQPDVVFEQVSRVLRPGGVFIFITPNGRHPLAHVNLLLGRSSRTQDRFVRRFYDRDSSDAFPTYYRANTAEKIEFLASSSQMNLINLQVIDDPTYLAFNPTFFRLASWFESILPAGRQIHLVGSLER